MRRPAHRIHASLRPVSTGLGSLLLLACLSAPTHAAHWTELPGAIAGERFPADAPVFFLDRPALEAELAAAPRQAQAESAVLIVLPMPDGAWEEFTVYESGVMHPNLAARFPEIRAYRGLGRNSRWRARFELTPAGFAASVWTPDGRVQIERAPGQGHYASAYLVDIALTPDERIAPQCDFEASDNEVRKIDRLVEDMQARGGGVSHGDQLHTYRLAVAATGEYTGQHGGTVPGGLAAIVETINRVSEIMTQEWSVALELIPNNDLIIFTDPVTDPYSNGNTGVMLGQNQSTVTSIIGSANYDQGHVFGTGPGGVANLASICVNNSKARGVSTSFSTSGEGFALLVAHEMGHQFGAHHSFNGDEGNCGPNRTASSAYEPGSGSTIMGYAGICGSQNLQFQAHDYYHTRSYSQVIANITGGSASTCDQTTPTGNTPPVALAQSVGYNLPLDTPWRMDGMGTDVDGDSLTYCWEEYDLGPAGHPNEPVGTAPIFRSRYPKTVSYKYFPKIGNVINGTQTLGEYVPDYHRRVRLRLTVRDGLGGVHWDVGDVWADSSAGPFRVTSQPTATTWNAGTQELVTWDVANTDNAIIDCQSVNILLSDGDLEFPTVLVSGTPNDGSELITVPAIEIPDARVMVQAADNIFFHVSSGDITIDVTTGVDAPVAAARLLLEPARPNPFEGTTSIAYSTPERGHASLRVYDAAGRLVRVLQDGPVSAGRHTASWDGRERSGSPAASGVYFVRLETAHGDAGMRKVHLLR